MKGSQAITAALKLFEKANVGDVRVVKLMEGSGSGDDWEDLKIEIEYAIDGDYTESDKNPFTVEVGVVDGKIKAVRL